MRKIGLLILLALSCSPAQIIPEYGQNWAGLYQAHIYEPGANYRLEWELRADLSFRYAELDYRYNKVQKQKGQAYLENEELVLPLKENTLRINTQKGQVKSEKLPLFRFQKLHADSNYLAQTWICVQIDSLYLADEIGRELSFGIMGDSLCGGFSGCNHFGGNLVIEKPDKLRIIELNQTLLWCDGSSELEGYYLGLLLNSRYYHFPDPSHLELRDSLRAHPVYFRRKLLLD